MIDFFGAPAWTNVGPNPITTGNGSITGAVQSVVAQRTNPAGQPPTYTLYAATINGGVWRSDDFTDAMLAAANLYAVGTLVEQNIGQSFTWYLKAAKAGNPEAEFRAGMAYAQGLGTGTDIDEAKRWLTAANDHGYAMAGPSLQSLENK